jgi:cysteine-rich repeat protein
MRPLAAALAWTALLALAGCGARSSLPEPECGDGHVDHGEECDLGDGNGDRSAVLLTQGALSQWVKLVERAADVGAFYGYASASGHTGFEVLRQSELFLFRDLTTGTITLITEHGIDIDSSGMSQPMSQVKQHITGLPAGVTVAFSDDTKSEFFMDTPTSAQGDWTFNQNTDGGGLSGLPLPGTWSIDVAPEFISGIDGWRYIDGDGTPITLDPKSTATLTAFETPTPCRADCTVPRCGDGILDVGEVCDDGNTVGGDGCSATCTSLE